MDFREKYLKYKKKYFILKNVIGGVINKPTYFHNKTTDQSGLDKSYKIESSDIHSTPIDINNPYIDTEFKKDGTPKITTFNKTGQYIPNSRLAQAATPQLLAGPNNNVVMGYDDMGIGSSFGKP